MKTKSNQIIVIIVAFLVGVLVASAMTGKNKVEDKMEKEGMEDAMENEESEDASYPNPTSDGSTATSATTVSKPSTEFVSGDCHTGLSGRKDIKLNAIVLNWSPCASDEFQFYKLVKSSKNTSPTHPGDPVAFSSSNKNAANFVDKTVAARTTYYYRMCVVQRLGKINCSNVATVSF